MNKTIKLFFDSDALIAGSVSQSGASFILLQLCELGLIDGAISNQVYKECSRNLILKLPESEPFFIEIVQKSLLVIDDPLDTEIKYFAEMAHSKDISILAAAAKWGADYLVTFNIKHYYPTDKIDVKISTPGKILQKIRVLLSELSD
ncbi:MAG: PIN domain-containing protein [Calditrichaeota bacterium]|nr:PIN domain-containing protein [Calditrichota bacterium]